MEAVHRPLAEPIALLKVADRGAAVEDYDQLRFLHFVLDSCCCLTESAEKSLRAGSVSDASSAFRQAEEAFHQAQDCLDRIHRADWRADAELMLEEAGLRLDMVWVHLMDDGRLPSTAI